ncbi:probable inactive peptidyl-prolyl cis-trans isomerase-like 6 [Aethina tumida]|uniref:probable inactive peptidyl-prolyl cis-trans isomerase-like 6 n=1 Tax=Aethina tumida TaxID=116153 RepID=UPI00096B4864|nr:probable inactive peptidyl-prolyl cis-trans isomerase-like 6 [Aethina tumida]
MEEKPRKFMICGLFVNSGFQMCKFLVNKLHNSYPQHFSIPIVRGMLDVQWDEYILKMKRKLGENLWCLTGNVVVFLNDEFVGDETTLISFLASTYKINLTFNWHEIGICALKNHLLSITDKCRQMVYFTVTINRKNVGTMLFELYNDLVPITCQNFLRKCESKTNEGYRNKQIHRVVKHSFIQCGGFSWPRMNQRCENYFVSHDKRGILGMCNKQRHNNNTSQFYITLEPTFWMDRRFVAFGQLIQGNHVLKKIEQVATKKESPLPEILIIRSGEYKVEAGKYESELYQKETIEDFMETSENDLDNIFSEPPSCINISKKQHGFYGLNTDVVKHKLELQSIFSSYMARILKRQSLGEGEEHSFDLEAFKINRMVNDQSNSSEYSSLLTL